MIRLIWYFGMGSLAHYLWIGSHVDLSDIFTYVCLLLGPIMVLVWAFSKAFWAALGLMLIAFVVGVGWYYYDKLMAWNRRRKRLGVIAEAKRRGNLL